jgi:DNA-binding protein HU-beta
MASKKKISKKSGSKKGASPKKSTTSGSTSGAKLAKRTVFAELSKGDAKKWLGDWAKARKVTLEEATHKVLCLGITRQMSLEKQRQKAASPTKRKTAKPAAAKVAKPAKKPAAEKKPKARETAAAAAPAPTES